MFISTIKRATDEFCCGTLGFWYGLRYWFWSHTFAMMTFETLRQPIAFCTSFVHTCHITLWRLRFWQHTSFSPCIFANGSMFWTHCLGVLCFWSNVFSFIVFTIHSYFRTGSIFQQKIKLCTFRMVYAKKKLSLSSSSLDGNLIFWLESWKHLISVTHFKYH